MLNLIKMDLYRMRKAKSFMVLLIISCALALLSNPFLYLIEVLIARLQNGTVEKLPVSVGEIIANAFPMLTALLCMMSACMFFHADIEHGYIKNIAGQMPERGYTILSKFLALIAHNLIFMISAVIAKLLGSLLVSEVTGGDIMSGIGTFFIKFLLMQGICAFLLMITTVFKSNALAMVAAVILGIGALSIVYMGIDMLLARLLKLKNFSLSDYMPDQLISDDKPDALISIIASAINIALFLPLSIKLFDRKDIK